MEMKTVIDLKQTVHNKTSCLSCNVSTRSLGQVTYCTQGTSTLLNRHIYLATCDAHIDHHNPRLSAFSRLPLHWAHMWPDFQRHDYFFNIFHFASRDLHDAWGQCLTALYRKNCEYFVYFGSVKKITAIGRRSLTLILLRNLEKLYLKILSTQAVAETYRYKLYQTRT